MLVDTGGDLRWLIDPIDPQRFKDEYWEKQPLLISRGSQNYYEGLLSLRDVDRILSASSIRPPEIRVLREGRDIPLGSHGGEGMAGPARMLESLYMEYRGGATIVLQFLHERWEPLARLCRTLAGEFSAAFQTNVYLTPAAEKGLGTHYDTHDVFVLQTEGSKHWRIYEPSPISLPLGGQAFDRDTMTPGRLVMEFDLLPGDFVYIPRGWMHDAVSRDSSSLHLTIGANTITWASVILRAVESVIESDSRFRESLPPGFALQKRARQAAETKLSNLLAGIVQQIEPASCISAAVDEAWAAEPPVLTGHLIDLDRLSRVTLQMRVRRRPHVRLALGVNGSAASLYFHGKTIQLPPHTEADLRFICASDEFSAGDLPGGLDDDGKLTLVTSLIREGLLTICPDESRLCG